jgi:hypothetical protein
MQQAPMRPCAAKYEAAFPLDSTAVRIKTLCEPDEAQTLTLALSHDGRNPALRLSLLSWHASLLRAWPSLFRAGFFPVIE